MPDPTRPSPVDDVEDRDPGLARERTELAWTRTAISFAAIGAAMLHINASAGALVLASAAAVWGLGHMAATQHHQAAIRRPRFERRRTVQLITAATTLVSAAALVMALLAPGPGYR